MTWSAKISAFGVESAPGMSVCPQCLHQSGCQLPKVVEPVGNLLTSVDTRCDGTWANGEAVLLCAGFEAVAVTETAGSDPADSAVGDDGVNSDGSDDDMARTGGSDPGTESDEDDGADDDAA